MSGQPQPDVLQAALVSFDVVSGEGVLEWDTPSGDPTFAMSMPPYSHWVAVKQPKDMRSLGEFECRSPGDATQFLTLRDTIELSAHWQEETEIVQIQSNFSLDAASLLKQSVQRWQDHMQDREYALMGMRAMRRLEGFSDQNMHNLLSIVNSTHPGESGIALSYAPARLPDVAMPLRHYIHRHLAFNGEVELAQKALQMLDAQLGGEDACVSAMLAWITEMADREQAHRDMRDRADDRPWQKRRRA